MASSQHAGVQCLCGVITATHVWMNNEIGEVALLAGVCGVCMMSSPASAVHREMVRAGVILGCGLGLELENVRRSCM